MQFYLSFWRSTIISCERVATALKSQFYRFFWRSNLISCERVAPDDLTIEPHFVRKGCAGHLENHTFTSVFDDRTSFRAKGLRRTTCKSHFYLSFWRSNLISCDGVAGYTLKSQFYRCFWRSNLISCERVARDRWKSQFYRSFWRSNLISCERVVFRAVSLALPLLPPPKEK